MVERLCVDVEVSGDGVCLEVESCGECWRCRGGLRDELRTQSGLGGSGESSPREPTEVRHRSPFEELLLQPGEGDGLGEEVVASRCEGGYSIDLEGRGGEGDDDDGHAEEG